MNTMEKPKIFDDNDKPKLVPLKEMFEAYCHQDPVSDAMNVNHLPFSQLSVWLECARIIDMVRVTKTDAFLCFFKFEKRAITYDEFLNYLEDLATEKDLDLKDLKHKLRACCKPETKIHLPHREN